MHKTSVVRGSTVLSSGPRGAVHVNEYFSEETEKEGLG